MKKDIGLEQAMKVLEDEAHRGDFKLIFVPEGRRRQKAEALPRVATREAVLESLRVIRHGADQRTLPETLIDYIKQLPQAAHTVREEEAVRAAAALTQVKLAAYNEELGYLARLVKLMVYRSKALPVADRDEAQVWMSLRLPQRMDMMGAGLQAKSKVDLALEILKIDTQLVPGLKLRAEKVVLMGMMLAGNRGQIDVWLARVQKQEPDFRLEDLRAAAPARPRPTKEALSTAPAVGRASALVADVVNRIRSSRQMGVSAEARALDEPVVMGADDEPDAQDDKTPEETVDDEMNF